MIKQIKNKLEIWTIVVMSKEDDIISGDVYILECENKEELKESIKYLKDNGQDLEYIRIFPPYCDISIEDVGNY